jgi:hypothetical protein
VDTATLTELTAEQLVLVCLAQGRLADARDLLDWLENQG